MSPSNVDPLMSDVYDEPVQFAPGGRRVELSWVGALPLERKKKTLVPDGMVTARSAAFSTRGWVLTSVFLVAMVVLGLVTLTG